MSNYSSNDAIAKTLNMEVLPPYEDEIDVDEGELPEQRQIQGPQGSVVPVNPNGALPTPYAGDLLPDLDKDYKYTRETLKELIAEGRKAIKEAVEVAKDHGSPRGYEVLAGMIKQVSEVSREFYELQEVTQKIKERKYDNNRPAIGSDGGPTNINPVNIDKAIFVGSTDQLLEVVRSQMPPKVVAQPVPREPMKKESEADVTEAVYTELKEPEPGV